MSRDGSRLVILDSDDIVFPDLCPVCGRPSTARGVIASSITKLSAERKPQFYASRRRVGVGKEVRYLRVPVCDEHYYSVDDMARVKSVCVVTGGVSLVVVILLVVFLLFSWLDRNTIGLEWYLLLAVAGLLMFLSFRVLGPTPLEKAISTENIDLGNQRIVLRIENEWYRDALVRSNPKSARRALIGRRVTEKKQATQ